LCYISFHTEREKTDRYYNPVNIEPFKVSGLIWIILWTSDGEQFKLTPVHYWFVDLIVTE